MLQKKLHGLDLPSTAINLAVFIYDSLCLYFKNLLAKCKNLWLNKFIHDFRTSNGSIRLKLAENGDVRIITDDTDLETFFPGKDLASEGTHYISCKFILCFVRLLFLKKYCWVLYLLLGIVEFYVQSFC